jgi:predicted peroxiredoxin
MTKRYLMVITHSVDDQDRANGTVGMAVSLLSEGADLALFFFFEGAKWLTKVWQKPLQGTI